LLIVLEGVYIRQGASSVPASESHILKMIKETDGDSYVDLRSLNQDLSFETLKREFDKAGIVLEKPQMKTLNIIDEDDLYTNLGFLLSDQCPYTTKAAVFEGSLIRQMREIYDFLDRYNRTRSSFNSLERVDVREYPETAIREALLNSIVHKDYSYGSSTLISVFDHRIEILTVGGLVRGLTKEDIMIGTSILKNKYLANVFYRLKWIEAYGTGILKIKEAYNAFDVKPIFEITDNAFKVKLPAIAIHSQGKNSDAQYSENELKIIEMLKTGKAVKRKEVEQELKISQSMAVKMLKGMLEKNIVKKIGTGKNVQYRMPEDKI